MDSADDLQRVAAWLGSGSLNIFGPPFAGKDTQGRVLADLFDGPLLGGGEILRQSHMPDHFKDLHRTGKLFPTDIYLELVLPYLSQESFRGKPLILSSVGRWHGEEAGVLEATAQAGHPIKAIILLDIDKDEIWRRWKKSHTIKDRGDRSDDSYEVLETRLEEFRNKTMPVIDFYRDEQLLIEVDGSQKPDLVTKNILKSLLEYSRQI
jgi:adenylate kinase